MAKDNHEMLLGELKSGVTHIMERLALGSKRMEKIEAETERIKALIESKFENLFTTRCNPCQARISRIEAVQLRDKFIIGAITFVLGIIADVVVRGWLK